MKTYLETEEVELLEKAATNLRDRLLVKLLFRLGSVSLKLWLSQWRILTFLQVPSLFSILRAV